MWEVMNKFDIKNSGYTEEEEEAMIKTYKEDEVRDKLSFSDFATWLNLLNNKGNGEISKRRYIKFCKDKNIEP